MTRASASFRPPPPQNRGQAHAFNLGVREARGEFIARQDADDRSAPTRLAEQLAHLRANPRIALLGTDMQALTGGDIRATKPRPQHPSFEELLRHNSIVGASVMIRAAAIDGARLYDENFKLAEDYELTLRMAKRHAVGTLPRPLYVVRLHEASTSRRHADAELLWAMLARDLHGGRASVDAEVMQAVRERGITAYLDAMPEAEQIWYHRRRASACKRHRQPHAAARHYARLQTLQGRRPGVTLKRWRMQRQTARKAGRLNRQLGRCTSALHAAGNDHLTALSYSRNAQSELARLCQRHGSDKGAADYMPGVHNYTDFYEILFARNRAGVQHVLEVGIGRDAPGDKVTGSNGYPGASLRVWRDYFPNARIIGVDILPEVLFAEARIATYCVDQTSPASIAAFVNELDDRKFDLIIDDGLHEYRATMIFFENIRARLALGGVYIIEDVARNNLTRYAEYFNHTPQYHAHIVTLHRPDKRLGDNSLVMITHRETPSCS